MNRVEGYGGVVDGVIEEGSVEREIAVVALT